MTRRPLLVLALVALLPIVVLADADDVFVARFTAAIGVDPIAGVTAATPPMLAMNVVRGVAPGGAPWHIGRFEARVRRDGHIRVEGRHLVLAAGNNIGRSLGLSVQAQLFCGAGSTTPITTTITNLNPNGAFSFDETLPSAPPDPCVDPVLLIVVPPSSSAGAAHWIAAGVPQFDLDD